MKHPYRIITCHLFLHFILFSTYGQSDYIFNKMTVEDGLLQNNIFSIFQDSYGYIWIGTGRGVHRYNGNTLKTYEHELGNPKSLAQGNVRSIFEDINGAIWIGTDGKGLTRFEDGKCTTFFADTTEGALSHDNVEHIIQMPDSSLYMATWGGGINIWKNGRFDQIRHDPNDSTSLPTDDIMDLLYDSATQILWVCTWRQGLCAIKNGQITRYFEDSKGFNSADARTLTKTPDGSIWIGTWGDGLFQYKNGIFSQYDLRESGNSPFEDNKVLDLTSDHDGNLWIGIFGGGVRLYDGKKIRSFTHNINSEFSISSNYIEVILVDNENKAWIGTYGGGITKIVKTDFTSFRHDPTNNKSISDNYIRQILELDSGKLWVGNRSNGIDLFDGVNFHPMYQVLGDQFKSLPVYTITQRVNKDIWFGGVNGAGLFVYSNGKVEEVSDKYGVKFVDYHINCIFESSDQSMWIGSAYDLGLIKIKGDSVQCFKHNPKNPNSIGDNNVRSIVQTSDSTLWIGTRRAGLYSYKHGVFKAYRSVSTDSTTLSNDDVSSIQLTDDGILWIATEQGLNKFDPMTGRVKRFFKNDGLIDDYLVSIVTDRGGNLWIGAHQGLIKIDPKTEQIWNYNIKNGINVYPFNFEAVHLGKNTGKLYFGGVGGLLAFHPDSIKSSSKELRVEITDFLISNRSVSIDPNGILKTRIEETLEISLRRGFDKLTFEFSDMKSEFRIKSQFTYMLEGFDAEWNAPTSVSDASYTNLPAGSYIFKVRATEDGLNWSEPTSLKLNILPMWWETIWFLIIEFLLALGLIYSIIRWRNRYLITQGKQLSQLVTEKTREVESRNREIIERNEQLIATIEDLTKTQKQLVQSEKMASLGMLSAGIAHEINNPMNFITGGVESLKIVLNRTDIPEEAKGSIDKLIHIIQEGVVRTTRIVKSLGHFSRQNDDWDEKCDIQLIVDNCLTILQNDVKNRIEVHKVFVSKSPYVKGNDGKLHQVILNILTNAVQSIENTGIINIAISENKKWIEIKIADTGCGISPENLSRINEPFFTTKAAGVGTGMGLFITQDTIEKHNGQIYCQSTIGVGTEFTIRLPTFADVRNV